jgi:hypothetical protein
MSYYVSSSFAAILRDKISETARFFAFRAYMPLMMTVKMVERAVPLLVEQLLTEVPPYQRRSA